jgi:hypothetical protein
MDLGAGGQPYKYRFAERSDTIVWSHVVLPGRRAAVAKTLLAAKRARRRIADRMPERARVALLSRGQRFDDTHDAVA